ncbi:MAG: VWA domain-containing protein [Pyrinomonadaceae bacterium]
MFFTTKSFAGLAAFLMFLTMLVAAPFGVSRAQSPADQPNTSRPRKAGDVPPQATPTPPTKPADDDVTLPGDEVVRTDTNLTNIFFTAADKHKRSVSALKREDIRVFEDGVQQEIFTFQQNIDLPMSLAILIDTSRSEERTLPEEKAAARAFLEEVMRPNRDEAAILSFTGEVTLEQGLTGNKARLRDAIDRVEFVPPSGMLSDGIVVNGTPPISGRNQELAMATAIWDAIWATSNELLSDTAEHTRRAIILLTDGYDTISQMKMQDAVERALKADALIYAIGIGDSFHGGVDEGSLRKITERTGGRAYFPRSEKELQEAFVQIQRDLREQYLVAYSPSNKNRDGSYRRIEIAITNPELRNQNLKLTYRQGYFSKTDDPGNTTRTPKRR